MSTASSLPASRWRYFLLWLGLFVALAAALIYANRQYFFREPVYEKGDYAANALSILRAEHGQELYGQYSRWGFRHPGPAVFYGEAAAEMLLYGSLKLVPTPYNAELLFTTLLMTGLLTLGLSVAARWVGGGSFLALALAFAALQVTAAGPASLLLSNWPPFVMPMAFFALLILTASVAAGEGRDLVALAFVGCVLLHMHVAQPLFVGPLWLLAYTGLAISCWRRREARTPPAVSSSALPWRVYRGTHRCALLIASLFALPIVIDLFYGSKSNYALILEHMRKHHAERHSYLASVDYLLRFAVYQASGPGKPPLPVTPATGWPEAGRFMVRHVEMFSLWLAALLLPFLAWLTRLWNREKTTDPVLPAPATTRAGRWRFLGWLWVTWLAAIGLTLYWGHIQDGPLYYYNAWFNYAIWLVLALLAAGALADVLEVATRGTARPWLWRGGVGLLGAALAALAVGSHAQAYLLHADDQQRIYSELALAELAHEPAGTPRAKLLLFPTDAWELAAGLAAILAREDRPVFVEPDWETMFGHDHVLKDWREYANRMSAASNTQLDVWRLVPDSLGGDQSAPRRDVLGAYTLLGGGAPLDPNPGFEVTCGGPHPNSAAFSDRGWPMTDDGRPGWTEGNTAWLQFQPRPVPAGSEVEITFDYSPYLVAGKCAAQRLALSYNGVDLGTLRVTDSGGRPNRFVIPGALWNKSPTGLVLLEMPDAMSPQDATGAADTRPLAFLIRSVRFAAVPVHTPITSDIPAPATGP